MPPILTQLFRAIPSIEMNHWDRYFRFYIAVMTWISFHTAAYVTVFGGMTHEQLNSLTWPDKELALMKCWALASAAMLSYLQASKKAAPPALTSA